MPELKNLGLLVQVNPELKNYYEALSEKAEAPEKISVDGKEFTIQYGAKYPFYKLYTNIRQGIMRYVAESKGKGNGEKKEHKKPLESLSLGHEIKIVVDKYFNEISDQLISARVTGIKEIERNEALKLAGENHEKLRKGVKHGKNQEFLKVNDLKYTSLSKIMNELAGLEYATGKFVKKMAKEKANIEISERNGYNAISFLINELMSLRNRNFYEFKWSLNKESVEKIDSSSENEAKKIIMKKLKEKEEFMRLYELKSKTLKDIMTQEEHETFEKIVHTMDMIANTFPQSYMKFNEIDKEILDMPENMGYRYRSTQLFNKKITEYKRLAKELNDVYGMDDNHFKNKKRFREQIEEGLNGVGLTDEDGKAALKKYKMEDLIPKIF